MKKIHSGLDDLATGYVISMLEQTGIEFTVRNQYSSGALGELPATECWPEIWIINDEDYEASMEIVRMADGDVNDIAGTWLCVCGERNEGQFASCWKCGSDRSDQRS